MGASTSVASRGELFGGPGVVYDTLAALKIGGVSICCLNSLCQAEEGDVLLCKEFPLNCIMVHPPKKALEASG